MFKTNVRHCVALIIPAHSLRISSLIALVTDALIMRLLILCVCLFITTVSSRGLREEFSWTRISYLDPPAQLSSRFRSSEDRVSVSEYASAHRDRTTARPRPVRPKSTPSPSSNDQTYIYQNNIPMGANVWNNKLFITVPRRRVGVPSSLNYVPLNSTERHNVPLVPYPDWDTNTLGVGRDGVQIVSVYRVAVDKCDRLWFVDTGRIETPGNPQQIQPRALVIIDLKTDKIIRRSEIDDSFLRSSTSLASVTVDVDDSCDNAYAYIPDLGGFGVLVYSFKDNEFWRIAHNYFYPEPTSGEFSIGGHSFQWNDGIFSIALSERKSDGYKDAYFHSMAGHNLYRVNTRVLKNESLATRSYHERDFEIVGDRGELSQTSTSALDASRGILFLGLVNQNALGCWNINTPLRDISRVQKDDEKMIYPSDVKISGDTVVVLTNTMPVFLYGTLDYDKTNFRVWVESVETAIRGTKCAAPGGATKH